VISSSFIHNQNLRQQSTLQLKRIKRVAAPAEDHMARDFSTSRIAVLGAGKMGGILVKALIDKHRIPADRVRATVAHESRAHELGHKLGIKVTTDNLDAVEAAEQLVISVAASVHTSQIEAALGAGAAVIRAMPNTPCVLGQGMTALCKGQYAKPEHVEVATSLFNAVGRTVVVDEKHMDAVTGLSASGPAYIYIILESLAEAGVKVGLPRDIATLLAAQTTLGAATVVLETGDHPALLKDAVTTPAGCTIDGIMELEEGKLRVTLIKAVVKAAQRAKELAQG
jgi:pyrroline-5-carboxylate reductase